MRKHTTAKSLQFHWQSLTGVEMPLRYFWYLAASFGAVLLFQPLLVIFATSLLGL